MKQSEAQFPQPMVATVYRFPRVSSSNAPGAFTLVELLAVIAVMAILISFSIPVLGDLLKSREMHRATLEIYDLIELARRQSLVSQRYTYLCLRNLEDEGGTHYIEGVIKSSRGATKDLAYGGTSLKNFIASSPVFRWRNLGVTSWTQIPAEVKAQNVSGEAPASLASQVKVRFDDQAKQVSEEYWCVLFSPQGYALFQPARSKSNGESFYPAPTLNDPYQRYIDISLTYLRDGTPVTTDPNQTAVVLNGVNGHAQILRR